MADPRVVRIYRAQSFRHRPDPGGVTIEIHEPVPDLRPDDPIEKAAQGFELEARLLCDTLFETLPGGTLDMLFAALARRKSSHLRVSYADVLDSSQGRLEAVRKLHKPLKTANGTRCNTCLDRWPCATAQALGAVDRG